MRHRFSVSLFFVFSFFSFWVNFSYGGALVYSTYLGGGGEDQGYGIAIDGSGNAYITGYTSSTDFPTTPGAFDISYHASSDVFVSKLNATGTALVYSTYLGGGNNEESRSIALDNSGNAYITGYTSSTDFPTTPGAFNTSSGGVFVSKLNASGTALIYSTYLGGGSGYGIALDGSGNAYITGYTSSTDFPTTPGAFDTLYNGGFYGYDAFVSKLNASGTALVYSTYLGGGDDDYAQGIAIDSSGNAYLTGETKSSDFPTTPGAFDISFNGGSSWAYNSDAFVTKLNASGTALVYSTYLGGGGVYLYDAGCDSGLGIAVDGSGNAYITGETNSPNFPTTPGAFDASYNGLIPFRDDIELFSAPPPGKLYYYDVFVSKLNSSGSALVYSTYLGGGSWDYGSGIAIDSSENTYITGQTMSSDFPTTPSALDSSYNGGSYSYDVFVSKLNANGTALVYSTYLGAGGNDDGYGIAIDSSGNAYITGRTGSSDFPTTSGAFDTSSNGGYDAFVTKMSLDASINPNLNSYGEFTVSSDTSHWLFEKYSDGISAGTLSWASSYGSQFGIAKVTQKPGEKGKLTQVFSVPSNGWYTAVANVATDIAIISKQQKVYLYLQELDNSTTVAAMGNVVVQPGAGGFSSTSSWRELAISFYCQNTLLGVQLVSINPTTSGVTGHLYLGYIRVTAGASYLSSAVVLNNGSFDAGTTGWMLQVYADGTGIGSWGRVTSLSGHSNVIQGVQLAGQKAKLSQLYSADADQTLATVWVFSNATSKNNTQKVYLYVYSYDSGYGKVIESGNGILQAGKWAPNQWRQIQFGYTPLTEYNAVQVVGINPIGKPTQNIYFDAVEVKQ
jgi:hypothetical protein